MSRVFLLGTRGIPPRHGAFEQFCHVFVQMNPDINFVVQGINPVPIGIYEKNVRTFTIREYKFPGFPVVYDIMGFLYYIRKSKKEDIALIFGYTAAPFLFLLVLFGRKFVLNMDGYEYKRGKFSLLAKCYLRFAEFCAVKFSNNIIVDSTDISSYMKRRYGRNCSLIAYGRDEEFTVSDLSIEDIVGFEVSTDYTLAIMRLEPENNYELIISSFLKSTFPSPLFIVGPATFVFLKYWEKVKTLKNCAGYGVYYLGPIYDREILNKLRQDCTFYVHGHSVGGMNPVLIESLSFNMIKICFDTPHNREVIQEEGFYFSNGDELTDLFNGIFEKRLTAPRAFDRDDRFTWASINKSYLEAIYEAV